MLKNYSDKHTGFAVALAWPKTYCKQAGAWYDEILNSLRIAYHNFYKVGHAAVLLIDIQNQSCHYFDFGRYHAPFGHGRVRSEITDHELSINPKPLFSDDFTKIINYSEILIELQSSDVYHGAGELHAAYTKINFEAAYQKACKMQSEGATLYGPFQYKGSNCSRFVNTVIRAGKPKFWHWLKLRFMQPLTPTPHSNVRALSGRTLMQKQFNEEKFCPSKLNKKDLKSVLPPPVRNSKIPKNALWLSGEGAGSWFVLKMSENILKSDRYDPKGNLECSGFFKSDKNIVSLPTDDFRLTYPTNCSVLTIVFKNTEYTFLRILNKHNGTNKSD